MGEDPRTLGYRSWCHHVSQKISLSTLPVSVVLLPLVGRNCAVDLGKGRRFKSMRHQWLRVGSRWVSCLPGRGPKNLHTHVGLSTHTGEDPRTSIQGEDLSTSSFFSFLLLLLTGMCGHLMLRTCCIALQCLRSSCLPFFSFE